MHRARYDREEQWAEHPFTFGACLPCISVWSPVRKLSKLAQLIFIPGANGHRQKIRVLLSNKKELLT